MIRESNSAEPRNSWYVVALFAVANAISFADRGFINLVIDPIKQTLHVTDTQMGLLIGPAFILFYGTISLPLGRMADLYNRKLVILVGIFTWSLCTFLFGLAGNFAFLFMARMGVGLGEAALVPAGISILGDLLPRHKIGRAVSIFTGGGSLGGSLAAVLGSLLVERLAHRAPITLPVVGTLAPWQSAFAIIALPGLVIGAVIIWGLREPLREPMARRSSQESTLAQTTLYLWQRRRAILLPVLGFAMISTASGVSVWMTTFYLRTFGLKLGTVGPIMGMTSIIVGIPGALLGGYLADHLRRRGREDSNILVAVGALCLQIPLTLIILNLRDPWFCFALAVPSSFLLITAFSVAHSAVALAVPAHMRALAVALYLLGANSIGIGIVPLLVALLTDKLLGDPLQVRYSMMLVTALILPFSIVFLLASRRAYVEQLESLRATATGLETDASAASGRGRTATALGR